MKKRAFLLFSLALFIFSPSAFCWSFTGHVIIAQIAYDNLSTPAKQKADQLAALIFNQLPKHEQEKLNQHYRTASTFAKLAVMPDVWRKWKLGTVYRKFNAPIPMAYGNADNIPVGSLHYANIDYPTHNQCYHSTNPYNVIWAIKQSELALQQTSNTTTQALTMIFLEHFVGDIHQPLHVINNVSTGCIGDAGGNAFCIRINSISKCTKNLHSLWDNAVGFIKPRMNIASTAWRLEQRYPRVLLQAQLSDNQPIDWSKAGIDNADFIYSLKEYQNPSPTYYQHGQAIATEQIALAGYRLADVLNKRLGE